MLKTLEFLTADDIVSAYIQAGYTKTDDYYVLDIRQLKFRKDDVLVCFDWYSDWDFPLKTDSIIIWFGDTAYTSNMQRLSWKTARLVPKEDLYNLSITAESTKKLQLDLENKAIEHILDKLD